MDRVWSRLDGAGLPHFESVQFEGAFPFARLRFQDSRIPLEVSLEAFNPFIPLNPEDSGLPAALFYFTLKNLSEKPVNAILFANLENKIGFPDVGGGRIEFYKDSLIRGLQMSTRKHSPDSPRYGTLALMTPHENTKIQTHWYRGGWFDSLHRFWDDAKVGRFDEKSGTGRS